MSFFPYILRLKFVLTKRCKQTHGSLFYFACLDKEEVGVRGTCPARLSVRKSFDSQTGEERPDPPHLFLTCGLRMLSSLAAWQAKSQTPLFLNGKSRIQCFFFIIKNESFSISVEL